jgi:transposase-like protein
MNNIRPLTRKKDFTSLRSIPYLSDNGAAHDLVDALRWDGKQPYCPRCESQFTKRVNTNVFRLLYRCVDCGYMFNSLSGTIFHGSKLPVYKSFHYFILVNALRDRLTLRDVCFALDCSFKTASLWQKRQDDIATPSQFATVDKKLSSQLSSMPTPAMRGDNESFFAFCEMKSIVMHEPTFIEYLRGVAQSQTHGPHTIP